MDLDTLAIPAVEPALVLSLLVGALHTCLYVLLRGRLRFHVLLVLPAAIAGAWAGQALGARLGDPVRLGDYSLVWASAFAWIGIVVVSVAAGLGARAPRVGTEVVADGDPPGPSGDLVLRTPAAPGERERA